jgi:hypothetical protein
MNLPIQEHNRLANECDGDTFKNPSRAPLKATWLIIDNRLVCKWGYR